MEQEDTDDLEVEQSDETVDMGESPADDSTETTTSQTDELAKAKAEAAKYRRLFEKAQKGRVTETTVTQTATQSEPSSANVEETVLRAQGMPDELLSQLKKVAAIEGISLIDAQKNDLFVAVKDKYEKEITTKRASAGASRGSGAGKVTKSLSTAGLSREEHMKLVKG